MFFASFFNGFQRFIDLHTFKNWREGQCKKVHSRLELVVVHSVKTVYIHTYILFLLNLDGMGDSSFLSNFDSKLSPNIHNHARMGGWIRTLTGSFVISRFKVFHLFSVPAKSVLINS